MTPADRAAVRHALAVLGDRVEAIDPAVTRAVAAELVDTVDEPLRIAVVGRVKAGKSTLVNSLVGRRIAPTDEAECTRVVTWYRFGTPERVELRLLDGSVLELPGLGEQLLPERLPVPLDRISHAVAYVQQAALRDMTLIDTPGLGSSITGLSESTRRAMLTGTQVDALVYVLREQALADDAAFLREFAEAAGARGGSAADVVGVLSHADSAGGGPWAASDPLEVAAQQAAGLAARRAGELGGVVPMASLLAEAAACGRIGERDAAVLAALRDTDPDDLQDAIGLPDGVTETEVAELAGRLGWYAIARGRDVAASGGASALLTWARDAGGRTRLERELRARHLGRQVQLRAVQALRALDRASDDSDHRDAVRSAIAEARLHPDLHPLRELSAWESLRVAAPGSALLVELERVLDAEDDRAALGLPRTAQVETVQDAARAARVEARRSGVGAMLTVERAAAEVLETSYARIGARWTLSEARFA